MKKWWCIFETLCSDENAQWSEFKMSKHEDAWWS